MISIITKLTDRPVMKTVIVFENLEFPVRKMILLVLGLIFFVALPQEIVRADLSDPIIPPGFRQVLHEKGVTLYRKDYPQGNPDFVQIVNFKEGAGIELLHGEISETRSGKGVYGGDDPRFKSNSLSNYWRMLSGTKNSAFCVTNGQFFYMKEYPTRLPFPLKKDGQVVSDGYGIKQFPDQKLILEIWPDHADIEKLSKESLYGSSAPDIVAGLTEDASKSPSHFVPRTFVGVLDQDQDGLYETLLIFNTMTARQSDAADVLKSFGAAKVMMLDGGGSTQLICKGKDFISSDRLIPQAMGVFAAPLPPFSATLRTMSGWPVINRDDTIQVHIDVTNTGSLSWEPGQVHLLVDEKPWGEDKTVELLEPTMPGGQATFLWTPENFSKDGVYSVRWYLSHQGDKISISPERYNLVVLPKELSQVREQLQTEVDGWQKMGVINIDPLYKDWLKMQLQKRMPKDPVTFIKAQMAPKPAHLETGLFLLFAIGLAGAFFAWYSRKRHGWHVWYMGMKKPLEKGQSNEKSGTENHSS